MNAYQQLLALLSGTPTQNNRIVKLHTPLGHDVLVAERLDVEEAIGPAPDDGAPAGYRIVVHALAADAHIELKSLLGQPVHVELLTSLSRTELRPWHGHVVGASLVGSDGGLARYRLVVAPWLAFLAHRQDSWIFQDKTVQEIVDEVFADYQGQGKLMPEWHWDLADPSVYPRRSLCTQYQETDLQFVHRLLREEGLFYWLEHAADKHTLVIADHNGAFQPNAQARVRYTQSGATLKEDSLTRWAEASSVHTASVDLASLDYRSGGLRPVAQLAIGDHRGAHIGELGLQDVPGVYAYETAAQGERLVRRQIEAIDALRHTARAEGTLRTAGPGSIFKIVDHPVHDGSDDDRDSFVMLSVRHRARNNVSADAKARLDALTQAIVRDQGEPAPRANETDEPLYACELLLQKASVPVRPVSRDRHGNPDPRLHRRALVHGMQTAIVVGEGDPVHADRDHRVKVQFHWQRGASGSHRLDHPQGDNAPASSASGTWVRVGESIAGANWGSNFTPRLGQEVQVMFIQGDVDRPVVVGAVYNGIGQENAQGNRQGVGAATATGNAAAWFPGTQNQGRLQGHQHAAVLSGIKTQELAASRSGSGGYNQLVFDDTPQANRIELGTTMAATRLQLGRLLNMNDNRLLQPRGHGLDLSTAGWGAARAGSGLFIGAYARPGSQVNTQQMDLREPQAALEQAQARAKVLAESAQAHNAKLPGEAAPDKLAGIEALGKTVEAMQFTDSRNADQGTAGEDALPIGGGAGTIRALGRPDVVAAAPGGVVAATPAGSVIAAGNTLSAVAGQDINLLAQGNRAMAVDKGVVIYTYGKAEDAKKPNTEAGIRLHAASGSVSVRSASDATKLTAAQAVDVASTKASVMVTSPQKVLLTASGAGLLIEGGNITLMGNGKVEFKAAMKELAGAGSASASAPSLPKGSLKACPVASTASVGAGAMSV